VYHHPAKHFTVQIGKGSHITAVTGLPVVCDFRSTDVALGGQGAPLVPIGDELLFGDYDYCLNLGGFANVSCKKSGKRLAWDLAPCNLPVNIIMNGLGKEYDHNGQTAAKGEIIPALLDELDHLPYYNLKAPKSLGREWVEAQIMPLLNAYENKANVLRTYYEHIARKIGESLGKKGATVLVTGGGAHNIFLMRLVQQYAQAMLVTPQAEIIDFKEAIVFAFLGYRRIYHQPNALKSVTGAKKDSISGCIYLP
jgi:anhydro-N-acetylmuramic acid kinase